MLIRLFYCSIFKELVCCLLKQLLYYITSFRICQPLFEIFFAFFKKFISNKFVAIPHRRDRFPFLSDSFCIITLSENFVKRFFIFSLNSVQINHQLPLFNKVYKHLAQCNIAPHIQNAILFDNYTLHMLNCLL